MSDETPEEDGPAAFGFGLPVPVDLVRAVAAQHDRVQMAGQDRRARVEAFLDSLDVEQLLALRFILNSGGEDGSWAMTQYFDGQVYTILRRVHGVNPDTGRDPAAELLEQEAAKQEPTEPPA